MKDYVTGPNTEQGREAVIYFTRQHLLKEQGLATEVDHLEHAYEANTAVDL